jgi:hypothetical protein
MGLIFRDADKPLDPKMERMMSVLFYIIIGILTLVGIFILVVLARDEIGSGFQMPRKIAVGLLSEAAVCGGLIALFLGIRAKKEAIKTSAAWRESDEDPWLKRADWATGRIVTSSRKAVWLLWVLVIFWFVVSAVISLVVAAPQTVRYGLIALILATWLAVFLFAVRTSSAWRRFGRSIFKIDALPAALGGTLQGQILLAGKSRPAHGWHVALTCIRRSTTGPSNNLRTTEKILWRDEKWLRADLPQSDAKVTAIPVFFQLPADKPESTPAMGDGTHWRLEGWAQLPGPDFAAAFEVPVFKAPAAPAVAGDPTIPYQVSLDEIRKEIRSKIQIKDSPAGKEFIFPGGRNLGFALGAGAICLIWTALIVIMALKHAPLPIPLVFGAIDLLMLYFVLDTWFHRSHIFVSAESVKIQTGWAVFKTQTMLKAADVANFWAESGAIVGHSAYYDLKLRTRDGKELVLAKNLGHKPEADWLARQMTAAKTISLANANA